MIKTFCWICLLSGVTVGGDDWLSDVEAATQLAKKENKDLLLFYTGSDWCPPCKKLHEEIFSDASFLTESQNSFVLVELDFPRTKQLDEKTRKQNEQWSEKFGIDGFPTVVLADPQHRPFGFTGYVDGGVENYLALLAELQQIRIRRDESFEKAKLAEGVEKAKWLDEAISELDVRLVELYYEDVIREIVDIDNEDQLGLRTKWNASRDSEIRKMIMTDIVMVSRLKKPEFAIEFVDEVLAEVDFPPTQLLTIYQLKLNLLKKLHDQGRMDALLDQMIAMDQLTEDSRQRLIVKKAFLMAGNERRKASLDLIESSIENAKSNSSQLWLAKGQLLMAEKEYDSAINCFETGIRKSNREPDVLIELYASKADCLMAMNKEQEAMSVLDEFVDNKSMPIDLRSEALLQKAMVMRDSGRNRLATLVENRAVEMAETPQQKAETQKLVERLRRSAK